jgi:hypothetical protein
MEKRTAWSMATFGLRSMIFESSMDGSPLVFERGYRRRKAPVKAMP